MSRIFITGSSDGLGRATARELQRAGHEVVLHVRSTARLDAVKEIISAGAHVVIGDLSDIKQTEMVAQQVNLLGRMDIVIHNAGISSGEHVFTVNVVAPYILTALITPLSRLIYLSSSMHYSGKKGMDGADLIEINHPHLICRQ